MKQPRTPEEWQEAADLAHVWLLLDSARQYGLVQGGPTVGTKRCDQLLKKARRKGIVPHPDAVDRCLPGILAAQ